MAFRDLKTVKQLAAEIPAFSEASLRWLLFNKKKNGLDRCVRKVGGRVLIDTAEFERWISGEMVERPKFPPPAGSPIDSSAGE